MIDPSLIVKVYGRDFYLMEYRWNEQRETNDFRGFFLDEGVPSPTQSDRIVYTPAAYPASIIDFGERTEADLIGQLDSRQF